MPLHPVGSRRFADENEASNILVLSPCKGDCQTKRGEQRKSPSRGSGGLVLHPLPPPLPPALQSKHRITPPPTLQCKEVYTSFFGLTLIFAAKSMQHTANQLQQWAKVPDFGVNSFTCSLLLKIWSICQLNQGVVLDRMCKSSSKGFIFCAKSCSGDCINGPQCSYCISKINVMKKIQQSNDCIVKCAGKQATISKFQ
jgi:hypothetical protein